MTPTPTHFYVLDSRVMTDANLSVLARGVLAVMAAHIKAGVVPGSLGPLLYSSGDSKTLIDAALAELAAADLAEIRGGQVEFKTHEQP